MEKEITVIGGGTGISTLLSGLKNYTKNINVVVTMSDDGGGSGILREDFDMLPPGDVRRSLIALSNTEPVLESLLKYRFDNGTLNGQNVGNILIAALNNIYGSFEEALSELAKVFNITGKIYPVTLESTHLVATLDTNDKIMGESIIPKMTYKLNGRIENISMFPEIARANKAAIDAIKRSKLIIIGPGSLYTSIIPNIIVKGIPEALREGDKDICYIANVMTQKGETLNYSVVDHIRAIEKHSYEGIFNYVFVNNHRVRDEIYESYYKFEESTPIFLRDEDIKFLEDRNIKVIENNFIEVKNNHIRHDKEALAKCIYEFFKF